MNLRLTEPNLLQILHYFVKFANVTYVLSKKCITFVNSGNILVIVDSAIIRDVASRIINKKFSPFYAIVRNLMFVYKCPRYLQFNSSPIKMNKFHLINAKRFVCLNFLKNLNFRSTYPHFPIYKFELNL